MNPFSDTQHISHHGPVPTDPPRLSNHPLMIPPPLDDDFRFYPTDEDFRQTRDMLITQTWPSMDEAISAVQRAFLSHGVTLLKKKGKPDKMPYMRYVLACGVGKREGKVGKRGQKVWGCGFQVTVTRAKGDGWWRLTEDSVGKLRVCVGVGDGHVH
ncbi:hypothetical protein HDU98_001852 [Podochytrium sp. JEL0797]|nr:hypothetical protein HDU98_001852 [Podochytrium sp. JEL0797]